MCTCAYPYITYSISKIIDVDGFISFRGYFPRGGGEVHIRVQPVKQLKAVNLIESGRVVRIRGWAFVAGSLPIKVK